MKPYVVINKKVGETPLSAMESYRHAHERLWGIPMAYAGRLDPMAEGTLLVLLGDECKVQEKYHSLDKEYIFEILLGVSSDTADVLGRLHVCTTPTITRTAVETALSHYRGPITLPYPQFSSKTVHGKPLHTWTLEGKISEISIPTKESTVYHLSLINMRAVSAQEVYVYAREKIETIPKVTDERKQLGNDFRRDDVRQDWDTFIKEQNPETQYTVLTLRCIATSGTYMRTLSEVIAQSLGTCGLAYSIRRTTIGKYLPLALGLGFWRRKYTE